jgi:hypothetical protein
MVLQHGNESAKVDRIVEAEKRAGLTGSLEKVLDLLYSSQSGSKDYRYAATRAQQL